MGVSFKCTIQIKTLCLELTRMFLMLLMLHSLPEISPIYALPVLSTLFVPQLSSYTVTFPCMTNSESDVLVIGRIVYLPDLAFMAGWALSIR